MIEIDLEKFKRLVKGEKVYFSRKPLQHGKNIFTYQLNELAFGNIIDMPDYNYSAKLLPEVHTEHILVEFAKSPLNEKFALFHSYMLRHPNKDELLKTVTSILLKQKKTK